MNFYFDPFIFACDRNSISEEELSHFIENLIDLKELIDLNWGQVYKTTDTYELLIAKDLYPYFPHIKQLIDKYNIQYIQPEEIDKIVNSILQKTPTLDSELGLGDMLYDIDNHNLLDNSGNRDNDFENCLLRLLIFVGIGILIKGISQASNILISKGLSSNSIILSAKLSMLELNGKIIEPPELPDQLDIEFLHFENFHMFCSQINPTIVWLNAESNKCYINSFYIRLYQNDMNRDYIFGVNKPKLFFLDAFFECIRTVGIAKNEMIADEVLRVLTEVALEINLRSTHEIRVDKGPNSKQLVHKGYGAWRKDINYDLHLHYWKNGNEVIFADLVHHNDYAITKF